MKATSPLTIPPACLSGDLKDRNDIRYKLIHFTQHQSDDSEGGHYVSFAKNDADQWHMHNDIGGTRTPMDEEGLADARNQSYIYVYERIPAENVESTAL